MPRKPKKKGRREEELKDFPQEEIPHDVSEEKLNETFGEGNWKSMPDEVFWQLRFEPARWIAEKHVVKVLSGRTDCIRMNFFVETSLSPCLGEVLQPLLWKLRLSTPSM